jgi:hypothetical protein
MVVGLAALLFRGFLAGVWGVWGVWACGGLGGGGGDFLFFLIHCEFVLRTYFSPPMTEISSYDAISRSERYKGSFHFHSGHVS